jgi:hypothetical protein
MRTRIVMMMAGLGLCACATDESVYRQANLDCQAIGITEKDPQFAACASVYARQRLENRLDRSYRDAQKRVPNELDYRTPHQDVY